MFLETVKTNIPFKDYWEVFILDFSCLDIKQLSYKIISNGFVDNAIEFVVFVLDNEISGSRGESLQVSIAAIFNKASNCCNLMRIKTRFINDFIFSQETLKCCVKSLVVIFYWSKYDFL